MKAEFYEFAKRLFDEHDVRIAVRLSYKASPSEIIYLRRRPGYKTIEFVVRPSDTSYRTWALSPGYWFVDSVTLMGDLVGDRLLVEISRERLR